MKLGRIIDGLHATCQECGYWILLFTKLTLMHGGSGRLTCSLTCSQVHSSRSRPRAPWRVQPVREALEWPVIGEGQGGWICISSRRPPRREDGSRAWPKRRINRILIRGFFWSWTVRMGAGRRRKPHDWRIGSATRVSTSSPAATPAARHSAIGFGASCSTATRCRSHSAPRCCCTWPAGRRWSRRSSGRRWRRGGWSSAIGSCWRTSSIKGMREDCRSSRSRWSAT